MDSSGEVQSVVSMAKYSKSSLLTILEHEKFIRLWRLRHTLPTSWGLVSVINWDGSIEDNLKDIVKFETLTVFEKV